MYIHIDSLFSLFSTNPLTSNRILPSSLRHLELPSEVSQPQWLVTWIPWNTSTNLVPHGENDVKPTMDSMFFPMRSTMFFMVKTCWNHGETCQVPPGRRLAVSLGRKGGHFVRLAVVGRGKKTSSKRWDHRCLTEIYGNMCCYLRVNQHDYGTLPFIMGKVTIDSHFQ